MRHKALVAPQLPLSFAVCLFLSGGLFPAQNTPPADSRRTYSEGEAWKIGWPSLHGAFSNFLPLPVSVSIVEDLCQASVLWETKDKDLGRAKLGSQAFRRAGNIEKLLGPKCAVHPGSWAGVIVAGGKVFASSFRPAGTVFQATVFSKRTLSQPIRFRIEAEDITCAYDAHTGELLWKAVEPGGIMWCAGKRGGFQVAPVYYRGAVYSMGSTGRVFAYDATTGRKLWENTIGATHLSVLQRLAKLRASASQGKWADPGAPGWHTSLVAASGVLIAPTFEGRPDTGLRGFSAETGKALWERKEAVSRWATPNVCTFGGTQYLLCATVSGLLHLIDPRTGSVLWEVTGLGPNYPTLSPSRSLVLVNVKKKTEKRTPGCYGCFRIGTAGARLLWQLPDRPENHISTWFDNCARQRYLIRNDRIYLHTLQRFMIVDAADGRILAQLPRRGRDVDRIEGLFYLLGNRLLVRSDSAHGPRHGGRHPFVLWDVSGDSLRRIHDHQGRLSTLDCAEFTTAYTVLMETPIVCGRVFEKTERGSVVCYDLRKPPRVSTLRLSFTKGYLGVPQLPVELWFLPTGKLLGAKAYVPKQEEVGAPYGMCRRFPRWERAVRAEGMLNGSRFEGTVTLFFGTHSWPYRLSLRRSGDKVTGEFHRRIPPLPSPIRTSGTVEGRGPLAEKLFPTPWLSDSPWTSFGKNPPAVNTFVLRLKEAVPLSAKKPDLVVTFDMRGQKAQRGCATAFGYNQAWHELDASPLNLEGNRLRGELVVILNPDWWTIPNEEARCGVAVQIRLNGTFEAGAVKGTYEALFGVPLVLSGPVSGTVLTE